MCVSARMGKKNERPVRYQKTHPRDTQDVIRIPDFSGRPGGDYNQIDHVGHDGVA